MSNDKITYDETTYEYIVKNYSKGEDTKGLISLSLDPRKTDTTTVYLVMKYNLGVPMGRPSGLFSYFSKNGIPTRGISARQFNEKNIQNPPENQRLGVGMNMSTLGVYGEAMTIVNREYLAENKRLNDALKVKKPLTGAEATVKSKTAKGFITDRYSEKNVEKPGELMDDFIINLKMDFGIFPEKHPFGTAGQSKIEIYDARTKNANVLGKSFSSYKLATIQRPNGATEKITAENLHEFWTRGSRIILFKYDAGSPSAHAFGLTLPLRLWKVVILPGESAIPTDEQEEEVMEDPTHEIETAVSRLDLDEQEEFCV
jgi:hypothetical protein